MSRGIQRARIDANQPAIVATLRAHGYSVVSLAALGKGCGDILVGGFMAQNWLFEIKDPAQPLSKRALTKAEKDFRDSWRGQYAVIETAEEALEIMRR